MTARNQNLKKTDMKLYALVVTLSTQDYARLLEKLRLGFKLRVNWNKYQSTVSTETPNQCLDYLIDPSFTGVERSRLFVFFFENDAHQTIYKRYFFPTVKIKEYNVKV